MLSIRLPPVDLCRQRQFRARTGIEPDRERVDAGADRRRVRADRLVERAPEIRRIALQVVVDRDQLAAGGVRIMILGVGRVERMTT